MAIADDRLPAGRRAAMRKLRRLLAYLVVAGVAMVAVALLYLHTNGPMTATLIITVVLGVFVSIVLGGGLMAMGFYSSDSGVDESVAGATDSRNDVSANEEP